MDLCRSFRMTGKKKWEGTTLSSSPFFAQSMFIYTKNILNRHLSNVFENLYDRGSTNAFGNLV